MRDLTITDTHTARHRQSSAGCTESAGLPVHHRRQDGVGGYPGPGGLVWIMRRQCSVSARRTGPSGIVNQDLDGP